MQKITITLPDHLISWLEWLAACGDEVERQAVADGVIRNAHAHTVEEQAAEMIEWSYMAALDRGTVPDHITGPDLPF